METLQLVASLTKLPPFLDTEDRCFFFFIKITVSLSLSAALASHDYILKIVPTVYEDLSGRQRFSYQYTVANKVLLLSVFPPFDRTSVSYVVFALVVEAARHMAGACIAALTCALTGSESSPLVTGNAPLDVNKP